MPLEHRRRRRFHTETQPAATGFSYTDQVATAPPPIMENPAVADHEAHYRFTVSPEELGIIGAELTRRLTFAAEEFLTELVEGQVRDAFRQELAEMLHFDD